MINLNSDLAEEGGHDEEILACVDSASIGCGYHAGSCATSLAIARRCVQLGIEIGAHPGYEDRANHGRVELPLSTDQLEALLRRQVGTLAAEVPIAYIKPHGALYHRCQTDPEAAAALARVAAALGVGVVGQPELEAVGAARRAGVTVYREGFADRAYGPDGRLVPRTHAGAVLSPGQAAEQAIRLITRGGLDTICVHGDSPDAAETAAAVRQALRAQGLASGPLR